MSIGASPLLVLFLGGASLMLFPLALPAIGIGILAVRRSRRRGLTAGIAFSVAGMAFACISLVLWIPPLLA